VLFRLDDTWELRFRDPRRFGLVDAIGASELARDRRFTALGLEPLSDEFTGRELYALSRGSRKPVKNFLMDASRIVGVGNIYASEALFLAGIHPRRAAGRLGPGRWEELVASVREVLTAAIERGGTTLRDFHDSSDAEGAFQDQLRVYDRAGEECGRCGGTIRRVVLAGRSSYYCPGCQR
jgi:formamidopyrimidine-DNA glycosylase